jgi:hypothetical protein
VFFFRFPKSESTVLVFVGPTSFASGLLKGAYTLFTYSTGLLVSSLTPIVGKLCFSVFGTSEAAKDRTSCCKVLEDGSLVT